jgi:transaldolase
VDGFVSLEVSPHLAHDSAASIVEAQRLAACVDRPNLFIKIPGTVAGLTAIEALLYEGININITLLFSVARYEAVVDAWLPALERRLQAGRCIDSVASVASFFLSRVDVLVDQLLRHRMHSGEVRPARLLGRTALANARLAYQSFRRMLASERWQVLERRGARPQRLLWASTSTKDKHYSDVMYVEPLIGPHTVTQCLSRRSLRLPITAAPRIRSSTVSRKRIR